MTAEKYNEYQKVGLQVSGRTKIKSVTTKVKNYYISLLVASPGLKMWGGQQGEPLKGAEAPVGSRAEPMVWGPGSQAPLKLKAFWCLYVYRTGHIIPLFGIWREKFTFHIQLKVNYSCEHLVCSLPYKKVKPPEASMAPLGEATGVIWTSPIIFRLCPL